jgi:hypothetical protein
LVTNEGSNYVPDPNADVAKEVRDYLVSQHEYGNREACLGKALENSFRGTPYGWDRDVLRLVLAVLFRAGVIEVSMGGQKFDSYAEPRSREPFINNTKFKSAVFTPIKPIDMKTLTNAVLGYESLTGKTVEVEKSAISSAAKTYAASEMKDLLPITAKVQAHSLPVLSIIEEYQEALAGIESGSSDDCVNILAGGAASLKDARERVRMIGECLNEKGLAILHKAGIAANDMAFQLEGHVPHELMESVEALREITQSETFFESMTKIESMAEEIANEYRALFNKIHDERTAKYQDALERAKGHRDWDQVPDSMREPVLAPLLSRSCDKVELPEAALSCHWCHAGITQMQSDILAVKGLYLNAVSEIERLTTPSGVKIERVRISDFLSGSFESAEDVRKAVERLEDHLLKLIDEGVKIVVE